MNNLWVDILPSLVKMPITAYSHRKTLQKLQKKLLAYLDVGNTNVLVLGRPSTGKTLFVNTLYGETHDLFFNLPGASTTVETKDITMGDWSYLFRVLPGQVSRERAEGYISSTHENKDLEGIIYVVDYGYTDFRDEVTVSNLINRNGLKTIDQIRDFNLNQEIDNFKKVSERIIENYTVSRRPKWLLILSNKLDLYHDRIQEANEYYHKEGKSEFSEVLRQIESAIGHKNINIISLPVCSFEKDYKWNDELIRTNIGGTDSRKSYFKYLITTLAEQSKIS